MSRFEEMVRAGIDKLSPLTAIQRMVEGLVLMGLVEQRTYDRLDHALKQVQASSPEDIRARGWVVAVHNDYRKDGVPHTFWLFTRADRCVKGEGMTDAIALEEVRRQLDRDESGDAQIGPVRTYSDSEVTTMSRVSMTFGALPEESDFRAAFRDHCEDGIFPIRSGAMSEAPMAGDWTEDSLWEKVSERCATFREGKIEDDDPELHTCNLILDMLGFEWI